MKLTFCFTCALLTLILMPTKLPTNAQTPSRVLPNDVIFMFREELSSDEEIPGNFRTGLNWLNADTLEVEAFFIDEAAYILPLEWSPNSELFAILRFDQSDPFGIPPQLCFLTRSGELLSCTEDRPPRDPGVASDGLYRITWSEDSRYIYFLNDHYTSPTQGIRRIIEVDVATGETQRIVFEIPFEYEAPIISWKSDLSEVIIGTGNYQQYQGPKTIINLETGVEIDPNTLIPDDTRLYEICRGFSPFDTYMAILAQPENIAQEAGIYRMALYVLDAEGNDVFVMDENSGYGQVEGVGCPIWQADESAIFFSAHTEDAEMLPVGIHLPRIFKHDFESGETEVYFENDLLNSGFFTSPLPSTDGNYLVLSAQYFTMEGTTQHRTWEIIIVFPDHNFLEIKSPEGVGVDWWYPIWVPQVSESS